MAVGNKRWHMQTTPRYLQPDTPRQVKFISTYNTQRNVHFLYSHLVKKMTATLSYKKSPSRHRFKRSVENGSTQGRWQSVISGETYDLTIRAIDSRRLGFNISLYKKVFIFTQIFLQFRAWIIFMDKAFKKSAPWPSGILIGSGLSQDRVNVQLSAENWTK